jgi:hypothetical protein
VDYFVTAQHLAKVAALLRQRIAEHDRDRALRCALIREIDAYSYGLKLRNIVADRVVGRFRKRAAEYEHDAERARRQRRVISRTKTELRAAA